jgi:hypothetical protein
VRTTNWAGVPPTQLDNLRGGEGGILLSAKLCPDLIKGIRNTAFCPRNRIQSKKKTQKKFSILYAFGNGPGQCSQYSDSLQTGWSGDRILVGAKLSAPFQTSPGAHPASYTMGTRSFPGVKRPGCGIDHPPPSSAKVKERVELYFYSPSGPSWHVLE